MPVDFWESLRLGFMQLREECAINPPIAPAGRLTAIWTAQPTRNEWRLCYHGGKDGAGVAKRFEWHAQSAAARLGFVGGDQKAVWFWLDKVRLEAPDSHVQTISRQRPDGINEVYSHEILDICGLSADYCRKCAADEMIARGVRPNEVMSGQQQRDAESIAASGHQLQGGTQRSTLRSEFWKERQSEFEKYSKPFHDLKAHWKSAYGNWLLWWGSTPKGSRVPQECMGVFNAITRNAVTAVPVSGVNRAAEPWQSWLDFMRESRWGFEVTGNVACTEREWDAGVKDGKPLIQVRKEQRHCFGDEWKKVYRRTKSGKLRRLSERELKGKTSEELAPYYHWLQDGVIDPVFETSARFCEDLSSRAFELEAARVRTFTESGDVVGRASGQWTNDGAALQRADNSASAAGGGGETSTPYLFERLSEDDPNYELLRRFCLEAWADSHGFVADLFAGRASLSGFVEQCVRTFEQGASTQVAMRDATPISEKCRKLDFLVEESIRKVSETLAPESERLGEAETAAANKEFTRRVKSIAARSKQQMCKDASSQSLDQSATAPAKGPGVGAPRRVPDLDSSRQRLELVDTLARELAILKQDLKGFCEVEGLKRKYPNFTLWTLIEDSQIKELVDGEAFTPKAYAEHLTLAKFGLTSRETLKKDRRKLRQAAKSARGRKESKASPSVPSKP